eukprot:gnl/MRDRNA2_/MRDRNA2_63046_c0_seq1.p1 gnl/MRDRNA2_/MRDRNA2_63046_c0~~gnl/MRDRNA2_/MRDRNA2_63046_c0_seq1.p1  ORF type:complete len:204 (-),score=41.31 gnl/MRDRNA2_/MRDRNA2_63046_c0_seq1:64-675(-)
MATARALSIPIPDAAVGYCEHHKLESVLSKMLQIVFENRPPEPFGVMQAYLQYIAIHQQSVDIGDGSLGATIREEARHAEMRSQLASRKAEEAKQRAEALRIKNTQYAMPAPSSPSSAAPAQEEITLDKVPASASAAPAPVESIPPEAPPVPAAPASPPVKWDPERHRASVKIAEDIYAEMAQKVNLKPKEGEELHLKVLGKS